MALSRVLEPEVMDSAEEASDYDAMDHSEVNQKFVEDLLAAVGAERGARSAEQIDTEGGSALPTPRSALLDILDLGTGTALIPIQLCKSFPDCRVMAADAAVNMLELARYNIEVNSLTERIELAHIDAKKLPFGDAMFDVVMSNSIIHHIPEPIHVLREAVRVTKPGGLLFFRDLLRPNTEAELINLVATYTGNENANSQRMFAESLHAALSLEEIRDLVSSFGFNPGTVQPTSDRHWTWIAISTEDRVPSGTGDLAARILASFLPFVFGLLFGLGALAVFVSDIPPLGFWGTTILNVTRELLFTATLAMMLISARCWLASRWLDTAFEFVLNKLGWIIVLSTATIVAFGVGAAFWQAKME